jgi:hypothetical protein
MDRWWVALVTFERTQADQDILPDSAQGACGWMACLSANEEAVRATIDRNLGDVGLRLLEVDRLSELIDEDEAAEIDEHLGANLKALEVGKLTVWGTIHCYAADGEA